MGLAARGSRNLDTGIEKIGNPAIEGQLRRQARTVYLKSLALAVLLTALCLALPHIR